MIKLQENEQIMVSTMLKSPDKCRKIFTAIPNTDHYFVVSECRAIVNAAKRLHSAKKDVNIESVSSICNVEYKDIRYIYDTQGEISDNNIDEHVKILKENALEYDLSNSVFKRISEGLADSKSNIETKAQLIKDIAQEIEGRQAEDSSGLKGMSVVVDKYKKTLTKREDGDAFFTTGDMRIDELMVYGFYPKEISLFVGRPSNGKSAICLESARRLANIGVPTAMFNLEMRNETNMDRLSSMGTKISTKKLVKLISQMTPDEKRKLHVELNRMSSDMSMYMDDEPSLSIESWKSKIGKMQDTIKKEYIVVYTDLLTKLTEFGDANSALDFEKICNKIQRITKQLGVHNILVLQINRSADKERLKNINDAHKIYPLISHVKNSGAFEEVADNIFLICRPSSYLKHYEWGEYLPEYIRVELGKQRGGEQSPFSNVILYQTPSDYFGLIEPEEGWDPLSVEINEEELQSYIKD